MNHVTFRNYASFSLGSTVVGEHKDGGWWTHDIVVGRGDHNHNNWSCLICTTHTGQIVTRTSKHIKATPIPDQLMNSDVDTADDILKHFERHIEQNVTQNHNKWVTKDMPVNTGDTQQSDMKNNITRDNCPNWIAVTNEQKENPNYPTESTTTHTRYEKIVKRPDRLTHY